LQIGADGSAWLVEPAAARVLQLDSAGRVRRTLRDERLASRPIAVVATETPGDIFVADSTDARIVVFEPFGRVIRRFGEGTLQSVAAMVAGPLGLYVVDRLAQQVVVFGYDGSVRQSFGAGMLVAPRAIAVDAAGRVFVADDADQTIRVFLDGEHIANAGGRGSAPGRFGRIDAMAADGGMLAVADGVNARVQLLLISPESLRRPEGARR
jgi:DNA-binding beta-propeller fold protein YncE